MEEEEVVEEEEEEVEEEEMEEEVIAFLPRSKRLLTSWLKSPSADYTKACDCVDHNKLRKALKEMGIPDHLTCLLRNLYVGQEATLYGTTDRFKFQKGVRQAVCSYQLCPDSLATWPWAACYPVVAVIKTGGRNINNLRYADDTTLMAESKEELKRCLMRVKEESERAGLKLNIKKLRSWHPIPLLHGK